MVGKLTFIWFSKSVNQASSSLEANKGLMAQTHLRKELFPLAVIHQGFYRQLVVFIFLIGFLVMGGYPPSAAWLWLIPLTLLQAMLITACGLLGAGGTSLPPARATHKRRCEELPLQRSERLGAKLERI